MIIEKITKSLKGRSRKIKVVDMMKSAPGSFKTCFKLAGIFLVELNRSIASELKGLPTAQSERPIISKIWNFLKRMVESHFVRDMSITLAVLDGEYHVVNGKHTIGLAASLPGFLFPCTIYVFDVKDEDELTALYACYDDRISSKTRGQVSKARQSTMAGSVFGRFSVGVINSVTAGLTFYEHGREQAKWSYLERSNLLIKHEEVALWLCEYLSGHSKILQRTGVVFAIICILKANPRASKKYLLALRDLTGIDGNHPAYAVREEFASPTISVKVKNGVVTKTSIMKRTNSGTRMEIDARVMLDGWVAWRQNRTADLNPEHFAHLLLIDLVKVPWNPTELALAEEAGISRMEEEAIARKEARKKAIRDKASRYRSRKKKASKKKSSKKKTTRKKA